MILIVVIGMFMLSSLFAIFFVCVGLKLHHHELSRDISEELAVRSTLTLDLLASEEDFKGDMRL